MTIRRALRTIDERWTLLPVPRLLPSSFSLHTCPVPFGWGDYTDRVTQEVIVTRETVSSAFRLGGLYGLCMGAGLTELLGGSPVPFGWGDYTDLPA